MQNEILEKIIDEFKQISEIKAIVLSGSASTNYDDETSDYDLYIYSDNEVNIEKRREIAEKFSSNFDINNQFWETGDEWALDLSCKGIDIMYRRRDWIEEQIQRVWAGFQASLGYTTCFVYNVQNAVILYDPEGWFKSLQEKLSTPYPDELAKNIIDKNLILLKEKKFASFTEQVEKAVRRGDEVSVNHRISAYLASYFDVLFAVNKITHPGEKRLVRFCTENCKILPVNFEQNLESLFRLPNAQKPEILSIMADNLKAMV